MPDLLDVIRDEAKAAKADPALLPSFKALRLNMGVADIEAALLLDASTWQRIEAPDRPQADGAYTLALRSRRRGGYECCGRLLAVHGSPRESLNNPMFAVSRGRGGLDVKLDDIADRPGAALVTGYGANGRYPRRSASFPAVPPAAGRLLPCHPVA